MLNIRQEIKEYKPIDLDKILERETNISDDIKNSIILYNKALVNLNQNSEDIAVIELKRSITLNPRFIDAMNLLGLCFMSAKDYEKAISVFNHIISIDQTNENALKYMDSIPSVASRINKKNVHENQNINETYTIDRQTPRNPINIDKSKRVGRPNKMKILYKSFTVIGILLLVIYIFGIIIGNVNNNNSGKKMTLQDYITQNAELKKQVGDLQTKGAAINSSKISKGILSLLQTENSTKTNDYVGQADLLMLLKSVQFSTSDKAIYDSLSALIFPKAADSALARGITLTNSGNFSDALTMLKKVETYSPQNENLDKVWYYMGKCYLGLNNKINAAVMFNKVVATYPDSSYADLSSEKLENISTATAEPSSEPNVYPTYNPNATSKPTAKPTSKPTSKPTAKPTSKPKPTPKPTVKPTATPTATPEATPSE